MEAKRLSCNQVGFRWGPKKHRLSQKSVSTRLNWSVAFPSAFIKSGLQARLFFLVWWQKRPSTLQSAAIQVGRAQVTTLRLFFRKESRCYYFKSTAPQVLASKPNKCNQQTQASFSQSWRSCTNVESPAKQRSKMAPAHRQPRRPLCPPVLAAPWARGTACFEKWLGDMTEYCLACS